MAKKGIIYETLNEVKSMDIQKSGDGFMHLSGVFGVCGVKNNNQRVYETKNYAKMVESMQQRLKKAPIPGGYTGCLLSIHRKTNTDFTYNFVIIETKGKFSV